MGRFVDLTGQHFGRLRVIERAGKRGKKPWNAESTSQAWICQKTGRCFVFYRMAQRRDYLLALVKLWKQESPFTPRRMGGWVTWTRSTRRSHPLNWYMAKSSMQKISSPLPPSSRQMASVNNSFSAFRAPARHKRHHRFALLTPRIYNRPCDLCPAQALTASVAKRLIFSIKGSLAMRTHRKRRLINGEISECDNRHRTSIAHSLRVWKIKSIIAN